MQELMFFIRFHDFMHQIHDCCASKTTDLHHFFVFLSSKTLFGAKDVLDFRFDAKMCDLRCDHLIHVLQIILASLHL